MGEEEKEEQGEREAEEVEREAEAGGRVVGGDVGAGLLFGGEGAGKHMERMGPGFQAMHCSIPG